MMVTKKSRALGARLFFDMTQSSVQFLPIRIIRRPAADLLRPDLLALSRFLHPGTMHQHKILQFPPLPHHHWRR